MPDSKLLIVGDTPTKPTGFGQVTRALAKRWQSHFSEIHIWGINHDGWPYDRTEFPYEIYPAGYGDWATVEQLKKLLGLIQGADYTHVWVLCDAHNLAQHNFPDTLRQICDHKKIHLTHYFPVDAPMADPKWLDLVAKCDAAVTYTEYGKRECLKARSGLNLHVLPHGVDTGVYCPLENGETLRDRLMRRNLPGTEGKTVPWLDKDEFLLLNVNRNERRKAPQHSLQIIEILRGMGVKAKLLMHCPKQALGYDMYDLESMAKQLGVPEGVWSHNDPLFVNGNGRVTPEGMNEIYNCADMVLTTSYGEGFGLSMVEGLASGCLLAAPNHTSLAEIGDKCDEFGYPFTRLPLLETCVANSWDCSRIRYPIDTRSSALLIADALSKHTRGNRYIMSDAAKEFFSWDRVASEFLRLMEVK